MPYLRQRGVGDVVPVPLSDWGFISPCQIQAGIDAAASGGSGGAGNSSLLTWAGLAVLGVILVSAFGGGD